MTCKYINKKNETKEEINKPKTLTVISFKFLFFLEIMNCEMAKSNDNQSARFPKEGIIN